MLLLLGCGFRAAFVVYTLTVLALVVFMVLVVVPRYGQSNIMVYIGICSLMGSLSVSLSSPPGPLSIPHWSSSAWIMCHGIFLLEPLSSPFPRSGPLARYLQSAASARILCHGTLAMGLVECGPCIARVTGRGGVVALHSHCKAPAASRCSVALRGSHATKLFHLGLLFGGPKPGPFLAAIGKCPISAWLLLGRLRLSCR